jgi:general secretion pathway protein D
MCKLKIVTLFLCFFFSAFAFSQNLVLKNSSLTELTDWVSQGNNYSFIVHEDLNLKISLNIRNVEDIPRYSILESVLATYDLDIRKVAGIHIITKAINGGSVPVQDLSIIDNPLGDPIEPVTYTTNDFYTKTYKVSRDNIQDVFSAVQNLLNINLQLLTLSNDIPLTFNASLSSNTNNIVLTAPKSVHEQVFKLINALDTPPLQFRVEALIYETTNLSQDSVGFNWKFTGLSDSLKVDLGDTNFSAVTDGATIFYNPSAKLSALFTAISSDDQNNVLSMPKINVIEDKLGSLSVGQVVPFITSQRSNEDGSTTNVVQRLNVGLTLNVTPKLQNNKIVSVVKITTGSVSKDSSAVDLITNNRTISTTIISDSEEIIHMAGLVTHEDVSSNSGVPILKDLPVVGNAFSQRTKKSNKVSLSVFLKLSKI